MCVFLDRNLPVACQSRRYTGILSTPQDLRQLIFRRIPLGTGILDLLLAARLRSAPTLGSLARVVRTLFVRQSSSPVHRLLTFFGTCQFEFGKLHQVRWTPPPTPCCAMRLTICRGEEFRGAQNTTKLWRWVAVVTQWSNSYYNLDTSLFEGPNFIDLLLAIGETKLIKEEGIIKRQLLQIFVTITCREMPCRHIDLEACRAGFRA